MAANRHLRKLGGLPPKIGIRRRGGIGGGGGNEKTNIKKGVKEP